MPHDRSKSCGLSLGDSSPKKRLAFPVQEIRPGENAFAIQERENARENDVYRFGGNAFYQQERINKGKGPGQPSPAKQPTSGGTRNSRGTNVPGAVDVPAKDIKGKYPEISEADIEMHIKPRATLRHVLETKQELRAQALDQQSTADSAEGTETFPIPLYDYSKRNEVPEEQMSKGEGSKNLVPSRSPSKKKFLGGFFHKSKKTEPFDSKAPMQQNLVSQAPSSPGTPEPPPKAAKFLGSLPTRTRAKLPSSATTSFGRSNSMSSIMPGPQRDVSPIDSEREAYIPIGLDVHHEPIRHHKHLDTPKEADSSAWKSTIPPTPPSKDTAHKKGNQTAKRNRKVSFPPPEDEVMSNIAQDDLTALPPVKPALKVPGTSSGHKNVEKEVSLRKTTTNVREPEKKAPEMQERSGVKSPLPPAFYQAVNHSYLQKYTSKSFGSSDGPVVTTSGEYLPPTFYSPSVYSTAAISPDGVPLSQNTDRNLFVLPTPPPHSDQRKGSELPQRAEVFDPLQDRDTYSRRGSSVSFTSTFMASNLASMAPIEANANSLKPASEDEIQMNQAYEEIGGRCVDRGLPGYSYEHTHPHPDMTNAIGLLSDGSHILTHFGVVNHHMDALQRELVEVIKDGQKKVIRSVSTVGDEVGHNMTAISKQVDSLNESLETVKVLPEALETIETVFSRLQDMEENADRLSRDMASNSEKVVSTLREAINEAVTRPVTTLLTKMAVIEAELHDLRQAVEGFNRRPDTTDRRHEDVSAPMNAMPSYPSRQQMEWAQYLVSTYPRRERDEDRRGISTFPAQHPINFGLPPNQHISGQAGLDYQMMGFPPGYNGYTNRNHE